MKKMKWKILICLFLTVLTWSISVRYAMLPKVEIQKPNMDPAANQAFIIPACSLMPDSTVFLIEERKGWFGDERIVRKVNVKVLSRELNTVSVKNGIHKDDLIVVLTDRDLFDGQEVWVVCP